MKDTSQIDIFELFERLKGEDARIPPSVVWYYLPNGGTSGSIYCGKCKHFLGCPSFHSWRLTPDEAEVESTQVWCAQLGDGAGHCPKCGANVYGTGALYGGIKNHYWWHKFTNNVPFTKTQLNELEKACRELYPMSITNTIKKRGSSCTFEVEVMRWDCFDLEGDDIEYYTNLWGDSGFYISVDVTMKGEDHSGHGCGYKITELDDDADYFLAKILGLKMAGE